MLIPLFAAIISCAQNVPFQLACQIDIACYVATVVFLYILGIPRKFNLGNELKFLFQYFVAFVIVFVMVDNGIRTVKGLI
ncbi:hypothetical protein TRFO_34321 [Tritrichomonas foetus]|uniref:Uncharacterized protein n=1 Tax=Tritrichomonas foetus TaxID=1144522 RepID=A0A1J4JJF4_9EUKA|nr:hypothetical protein TRFO_34321 [Tritrichomonas foetus]|eukprot:OHS99286.1 hypothetical protein TRFO_34321 [Tritrichomonas foetus]